MRNQCSLRRINSRRRYESRDVDVLNRKLDALCDELSDQYGANIASNKVVDNNGDLVAVITVAELEGSTMDIQVGLYGDAKHGFGYEAIFYLDDDYVSDYMPTLKFRTEVDALLNGVEDAMAEADKHNFWLDMDYSGYDEDGGDYYDSEYESRRKSSCRYEARMLKVRKTRPSGYRTMIIRDYNTYDVIGYVDLSTYGSVQVESGYKDDKHVLVIRDYNTYSIVAYVDVSDLPSIQWEFS